MWSQTPWSARTHQPPVTVPGSWCLARMDTGTSIVTLLSPKPLPCALWWLLEEMSPFHRDKDSKTWSWGPETQSTALPPSPKPQGWPSLSLGCPHNCSTPRGFCPSARAHGDIQRRLLQLQSGGARGGSAIADLSLSCPSRSPPDCVSGWHCCSPYPQPK